MPDDGVNKEKCSISVPAFLTAGVLVCSMLLGTLQWVGAPAHGGTQIRQSGEKLSSFMEQRLSDTLRGLNGLERIYWIDRHALSAPKPDPTHYSEIDSPEGLAAVAQSAQSLLGGQTLFLARTSPRCPGQLSAATWTRPSWPSPGSRPLMGAFTPSRKLKLPTPPSSAASWPGENLGRKSCLSPRKWPRASTR